MFHLATLTLKTEVGPKENRCIIVRRVSRAPKMRISNPFYGGYVDVPHRKELKGLYPYQIGFLCEKNFLPTGETLSHICSVERPSKNPKKGVKCVVAQHMVLESIGENRSRESCFSAIRKKISAAKEKKRFKTWTHDSCEHHPVCFINTGVVLK